MSLRFIQTIEDAIYNSFNQLDNKLIYIAYSGGVDSQVLLRASAKLIEDKRLDKQLSVCHIHHGLSENSDEWLLFAKDQSNKYQADFKFQKVNVCELSGGGLEAAARNARYQALVSMTHVNDIIATGHHNDDQAETFLLALKRGSGITGLSAMKPLRNLSERKLIRPLLNITRHDIERYARHHQLSWVEDESNADITFDRNFLRNDVLPALEKRWPAIKKTIARSAQHCSDAQTLILEITQQDFNDVSISNSELSLPKLLRLSRIRFNHVIRFFLEQHNSLMPSQVQLQELAEQLLADEDKSPALKFGNHWLRRYRNSLFITPNYLELSDWQHTITLSSVKKLNAVVIKLPDNLGSLKVRLFNDLDVTLRAEQQVISLADNYDISLSYQHNNPTCTPEFRHKRRALKKILQELAIPVWERKRQLYLYQNNNFVAMIGQFSCQQFKNETELSSAYKKYIVEIVH